MIFLRIFNNFNFFLITLAMLRLALINTRAKLTACLILFSLIVTIIEYTLHNIKYGRFQYN